MTKIADSIDLLEQVLYVKQTTVKNNTPVDRNRCVMALTFMVAGAIIFDWYEQLLL